MMPTGAVVRLMECAAEFDEGKYGAGSSPFILYTVRTAVRAKRGTMCLLDILSRLRFYVQGWEAG